MEEVVVSLSKALQRETRKRRRESGPGTAEPAEPAEPPRKYGMAPRLIELLGKEGCAAAEGCATPDQIAVSSLAKLGLVGLMNSLKIEGAKNNIHTNAIAPVIASGALLLTRLLLTWWVRSSGWWALPRRGSRRRRRRRRRWR